MSHAEVQHMRNWLEAPGYGRVNELRKRKMLALLDEVDRYREALRQITLDPRDPRSEVGEIQEFARQALAAVGGDPE